MKLACFNSGEFFFCKVFTIKGIYFYMEKGLDPRRSGIYRIRNLVNGKQYIGSTAGSFSQRFANHRSQLILGTHANLHLLRSWRKYGEAAFAFEVVEHVQTVEDLHIAEQRCIDKLDVTARYNLAPVAGSCLGCKRTEDFKRNLSLKKSKITWHLLSPDGDPVLVVNLARFAKEHDIDYSALYKVAKGKLRSYKGWGHPVLARQPKRTVEFNRNTKSKLTLQQKREIQNKFPMERAIDLAALYGVSVKTIYNAIGRIL